MTEFLILRMSAEEAITLDIDLSGNFSRLERGYVFAECERVIGEYERSGAPRRVIRLGIGDATLPVCPAVSAAFAAAAEEMSHAETFRGYPPVSGYSFLRDAASGYYRALGASVSPEDIYISDGTKSDAGNIYDILGDCTVCIPDPGYPAYRDCAIMAGKRTKDIPAAADNSFLPMPDCLGKDVRGAAIWLCSPGNPTGAAYTEKQLGAWVDFALESGSLILFDAAYAAFAAPGIPRTIYAVKGAEECAIEFYSLSKSASFTGIRCAWCVIPSALCSGGARLTELWRRRLSARSNGVSYPVQRAAQAALSKIAINYADECVRYYKENAAMIKIVFEGKGIEACGAASSPYVWIKCPDGYSSEGFFDRLLRKAQIAGTPGDGFGSGGRGYLRLTGFGTRADTEEAARRLDTLL